MRPSFLTVVRLACMSLLEIRMIDLSHWVAFQKNIDVAAGVVSGHPFWKAYQNRLLGPETIAAMSHLTHLPFSACYKVFYMAMVCLANATCYFLFWKHGGRSKLAWYFTVLYAVLIVTFEDFDWFYLWDSVDLTVMLIFAWAVVVGGVPLWQLVALFFVELFNRESAEFIALWMMIDSVRFQPSARVGAKVKIDPARLVIGAILVAICVGWTGFIRNRLMIEQVGVTPADTHPVAGQLWMLMHSVHALRSTSWLTVCAVGIFLGMSGYLFWRARGPLGPRSWNVGLLLCGLIAANLCFAFCLEIRVWLTLLPMLLCLGYVRYLHDEDATVAHPSNAVLEIR